MLTSSLSGMFVKNDKNVETNEDDYKHEYLSKNNQFKEKY